MNLNSCPLALSFASILGLNAAIALPAVANDATPTAHPLAPPMQLAQIPTACPPGFIPETPTSFEPRFGYNLECWDLTRSGIICVNNPNPECGVEVPESFSYNVPERRYDTGYQGFTCVNNPNPDCGNPVRYGTLYGSEYKSELLERTALLWAEYEGARAGRPALPALTSPASAPLPAPIPGLW